jgi:deoxyribodipyrimidine photolyase
VWAQIDLRLNDSMALIAKMEEKNPVKVTFFVHIIRTDFF